MLSLKQMGGYSVPYAILSFVLKTPGKDKKKKKSNFSQNFALIFDYHLKVERHVTISWVGLNTEITAV